MKRLEYNHEIVESGAYIRVMTHYTFDYIFRKGDFHSHYSIEEFKRAIVNLVHLILD